VLLCIEIEPLLLIVIPEGTISTFEDLIPPLSKLVDDNLI